jgi:uncharacterized membrane protein
VTEPRDSATELNTELLRHNMRMDEREQARADRELEQRMILARRGQDRGLASLVLILVAVVWLALTGHEWVSGAVGGSYLVSVIGLFVTGSYKIGVNRTPERLPTPRASDDESANSA